MKERTDKIKEAVKEIANNVEQFVVDTTEYIVNHPVASAIVLIPAAWFYASMNDMFKD